MSELLYLSLGFGVLIVAETFIIAKALKECLLRGMEAAARLKGYEGYLTHEEEPETEPFDQDRSF